MSLYAMSMLASDPNVYHVPKHSDAPLDVLLATLASIALLLVMIIPPVIARSREDRRLAEAEPPTDTPEP